MPKSSARRLPPPKKKKKASDQTERMVNEKYWGKVAPDPFKDRAGFLTWCSYLIDLRGAREWLDEYLKPTGRSSRGVPDKWINPSACYRARMSTLGVPFNPLQQAALVEGVEAMLLHVEETTIEGAPVQPTIADRIREKASEAIGEVLGMIDDGVAPDFSIEKWMRDNMISPTVARRIRNRLVPECEEILSAVEGTDPQLAEAYSRVPNPELLRLIGTYTKIISDIERLVDNDKKARVVRKPKAVSVEKKIQHMTFLKHSKDYNVTSLDPSKIIGAKELWTLNVKYKLLTVYRTDQMGGLLDVQRSKVTGFNRNDSYTYRLGRGEKKSKGIISEIVKSSRARAKQVIVGLKEAPLQERVAENTVLLRVM